LASEADDAEERLKNGIEEGVSLFELLLGRGGGTRPLDPLPALGAMGVILWLERASAATEPPTSMESRERTWSRGCARGEARPILSSFQGVGGLLGSNMDEVAVPKDGDNVGDIDASFSLPWPCNLFKLRAEENDHFLLIVRVRGVSAKGLVLCEAASDECWLLGEGNVRAGGALCSRVVRCISSGWRATY
jgi:hypothetical protein